MFLMAILRKGDNAMTNLIEHFRKLIFVFN